LEKPTCLKCGSDYGPDGSCINPECDGYYHICDWCTHRTENGELYCLAGLECPEFPEEFTEDC